jgi:transcriptional regulator with XRE-family HTH domain
VLRFRTGVDKIKVQKEHNRMEPKQAEDLGKYLRRQREAKGVSTRTLAAEVGIDSSRIVRLEQGQVASPRGDVLAGIADFLGLPLADVFGLAGYAAPTELPSFRPYLRVKYHELPSSAVAELERSFTEIAKRYGTGGPRRGEDEH